jgi:serine/threonine protein kinase
VIHRDLKPDNVFHLTDPTSSYPAVKLSDFEFAIETSAEDGANTGVWRTDEAGHPGYRPMELRTDQQRRLILSRLKADTGQVFDELSDEKVLAAANVSTSMSSGC